MNGLTDKQQAVVTLVSAGLIGVGATSIPAGAPSWAGLALAAVGAVGLAIKEALGTPQATTSSGGSQPTTQATAPTTTTQIARTEFAPPMAVFTTTSIPPITSPLIVTYSVTTA